MGRKLSSRFPKSFKLILAILCTSRLWPLPAQAELSPRQLLAAGHADEAVRTLQQKIEHSATDAESHNLLCRAYFMLEDWDRSVSACERARALDPRNSSYHLWLGRAYGEKAARAGFLSAAGLAKKVRVSFERAVELDPKNWEARTDLAEFYIEAPGIVGGGRDKAEAQADALMSLNPAMSHWVAARIAEKSKNAVVAEREYRAEIASSHSGSRGWLDLAIFFRHANRLDEMEQALNNLESSPVDRPESLMDGGSVLLRAGRNYPLGVRLLRRYLAAPAEAGPAFKAHDLLGELLEKQGELRAAAEQYHAALSLAHQYSRPREDLRRIEH
jgi:tetratricopeptide (TPR) repeat protein